MWWSAEKRFIQKFVKADKDLKLQTCGVCREICWNMKLTAVACQRCSKDKGDMKKWSTENNVHPADIPQALKGLIELEEMMAVMSVRPLGFSTNTKTMSAALFTILWQHTFPVFPKNARPTTCPSTSKDNRVVMHILVMAIALHTVTVNCLYSDIQK
ncbi:hypothetical protein E1B28_010163 [Marasmius oreades]|uniref:Uncharacterized protein n=1 Tax=Marasmius oreades TaxID=181124 RepID=A0A9P7RWM6_9AGAR|nr:uncharacterized protein E1B28_010163 [Marasmius oreades]KAG7091109.1 hypothetical protein E1B28_010163 [Marasmius oreades]